MDVEWDGIAGAEKLTVPSAAEGRPNRDSMFLAARLWIGEENAGQEDAGDVRIRNLSERGLMAELNRSLEPGTAVSAELRGIGRVTGKVAWCAAGRVGVALDQEIVPTLARKPITLRPAAPVDTGYRPRRPGRP